MQQHFRSTGKVDDGVISELYRVHAPALLTHLRVNMQSKEDAEDLLLDVFLAALESAPLRTLPLEQQRFWLWRVARNKLVDYYRRSARRRHLPLEEASEAVYDEGELVPEWVAQRNEEHRNLVEAINDLPPLYKEILLLRFVDGLRASEIARLLGKQDAAVRMLLARILRRLRGTFEKRLGQP